MHDDESPIRYGDWIYRVCNLWAACGDDARGFWAEEARRCGCAVEAWGWLVHTMPLHAIRAVERVRWHAPRETLRAAPESVADRWMPVGEEGATMLGWAHCSIGVPADGSPWPSPD